jgi:hypothetical protein
MRLFRRKPKPVLRSDHPGIILRIRIPGGTIMQANSMHMHWQAKYGAPGPGEWHEVIRTVDGLVVEAQAVMLTRGEPTT